MTKTFERFPLNTGLLADLATGFPSRLHAWSGDGTLSFENDASTRFGFVYEGPTQIETEHTTYSLVAGHYFSLAGRCAITGGSGIVMERVGVTGLNTVGGPVETRGRLRYISGCSDTLLVSPVRFGDPCLNALYFPPDIDQQPHTHPSVRIGIVARGGGWCRLPEREEPLRPGDAFVIHPEAEHSFRTEGDQGMTVIAYHPDSDFGPQDTDHPMINRTYVEGISASKLDKLHSAPLG